MNENDSKFILGQKIKAIRNSLGLTQEAFCSEINLEISNLSNIENGKNFPSVLTVLKILNKFHIEPNELLDMKTYDSEEVVNELFFEYFNKLPIDKKIMTMKIVMMINENDKNF